MGTLLRQDSAMQRVMITGGPGSGKSTLARALGAATGLPVFHMDKLHWKPGWVPRPLAEKVPLAHAIENRTRWIFEGGLSTTYDHRAARADTLIWLDLPIGLRFWRVLRRLITSYGRTRPDVTEDCPEVFHSETIAFWKWIWNTRHSHRTRLLRLIAAHPHLTVHHLTSRRAVRDFYARIGEKHCDH